jgi:hypothetical protein
LHPCPIGGEGSAVDENGAGFKLDGRRTEQLFALHAENLLCGAVAVDDDPSGVAKDHAGADVVEKFRRDAEFLLRVQVDIFYERFRHRVSVRAGAMV